LGVGFGLGEPDFGGVPGFGFGLPWSCLAAGLGAPGAAPAAVPPPDGTIGEEIRKLPETPGVVPGKPTRPPPPLLEAWAEPGPKAPCPCPPTGAEGA
jgi:hypothetical protein